MKKKKSIFLISFSIILLSVILTIFLINKDGLLKDKINADISNTNNQTIFKDWEDGNNNLLNSEYSNSTIYLSNKTEFIVYRDNKKYSCDFSNFSNSTEYIESESGLSTKNKYNFTIKWNKYTIDNEDFCFPRSITVDLGTDVLSSDKKISGNNFNLLIKNSVTNSKGEFVDALFSINDILFLKRTGLRAESSLEIIPYYCINNTAIEDKCTSDTLTIGSPLNFGLQHKLGSVKASLKYLKAGSYEKGNPEKADINYVNGFFSDIDIYNSTNTTSVKFNGNEGINFENKNKTIYYDKTGVKGPSPEGKIYVSKLCNDGNSGIYVCTNSSFNINNIHPQTSAYITTDISNENSFNFEYSAAHTVGINFSFISPFQYKYPNPIKNVSVTKVTGSENYNYMVSQYVPNNYYSTKLNFLNNTLYDEMQISDELDENLIIDKKNIKIYSDMNLNENVLSREVQENEDVTNYFTISTDIDKQTNKTIIKATINNNSSSEFNTHTKNFYNHVYTLVIPVTTKEKINKEKINNISTSSFIDNTDNNNLNLSSNDTEVKVYYTVTENYINENTNEKILDTKITNVDYNELFSGDKKNIDNYVFTKYTSTDDQKLQMNVTKNITINYYYKRNAKIVINYIDENTNNTLSDQTIINTTYNEKYDVTEYKDNKNIPNKYIYSKSSTEYPLSGTVNQDLITINYYYKLKSAKIIINYLDEETNNELATSTLLDKKYDDNYDVTGYKNNSNILSDYVFSKFTSSTNNELTGVVNKNEIIINYYYKLKDAKILINYLIEGTNTKIADSTNIQTKYGKQYDVTDYKDNKNIPNKYIYSKSSTEYPLSGTVNQDLITINYYYKLKSAKIIVKYLENETNKILSNEYSSTIKYDEKYNATEIRNQAAIPGNYELVRYESSTKSLSGIVDTNYIEIIFYYKKKDPTIDENLEKTGTTIITKKNDKVKYNLSYKGKIKDYIGQATLTIIDKLPYEIDEKKSDLSNGIYNNKEKTITWIINYDEINIEKEITFTKNITLVYIGIKDTDRIMTNIIESQIKLDNKNNTIIKDFNTDIKIPGKIIVHYYDIETKEKLTKDIEKTDLIGNEFITEEKIFEGYKLVNKPKTNYQIYKEQPQEFNYEYEKLKFKITTKVDGDGGTIEGDETVKYRENSTVDKIKIKAKEGYEINKITINGKDFEITDNEKMTIPYFKKVTENKEIIVSFNKKIINPKTLDNIYKYIICLIVSIVGIITSIISIKTKTQKK